jgi:hypothetical protein
MPQSGVLLSTGKSRHDLNCGNFVTKDLFATVVELSPEVEVLLSAHVGNVRIDQTIALVVLVDYVERFPVPLSQKEPLSVFFVVAQNSMQAAEFVL